MTTFAEVRHREWIAASLDVVRAQFADLDQHIAVGVHPALRFAVLERRANGARLVQAVKLLGLRQRDVFERTIDTDGGIVDRSVEGFNRGGSPSFAFAPEVRDSRPGTTVSVARCARRRTDHRVLTSVGALSAGARRCRECRRARRG